MAKKVFLSVPMKGRKREDIEKTISKMKALTKLYLDTEDLEFINTEVKEQPLEESNQRIWYLGKSIQLLSKCDILVTCLSETNVWLYDNYPGCKIELEVGKSYGMSVLSLNNERQLLLPDLLG